MNSKNRKLVLLVGLMMLSFFIRQAFPANSSAEKHKSRSIHFAFSYEFNYYYDPADYNYSLLQPFFSCIYSTLYRFDTDMKPYPFLLDKIDRKGKTVVFYLKHSANFSDGSPITAEDVVDTLEYVMTRASYPNPIYKLIEGGEEFSQKKTQHCSGIKVLGSKTFEIRFVSETVEFSYYFASNVTAILPKNRSKEKVLCSGPYFIEEYRNKKDEVIIKLKQNPWYIGRKNNIDYIYAHFYARRFDYERTIEFGEPDIFFNYQYNTIPYSRFKYSYFKIPPLGGFYFILNAKRGPFKDIRLRKLFKNVILSLNLAGSENWEMMIPSKLVLPYSLTGYFVFNHMVPEDIKDLIPTKPVTIKCMTSNVGFRQTLFAILKKKLSRYNINIELDWKQMDIVQEHQRRGDIDMTSYYHVVDIPLSGYFYETMFTPGQELNLFSYSVPEASTLLRSYHQETDEIKKLKILSRLEEIAQYESFFIPLFNPLCFIGYKSNIKGVCVNGLLNLCIEDMYVGKRN